MKPLRTCNLCDSVHFCRGMCRKHYGRWYRTGTTEVYNVPANASPDERLNHYGWCITEAGCWEWAGNTLRTGYGRVSMNSKTVAAHRLAYETWVGPIPEGHVVRHKCDNPPCINPAHLETGTHLDNMKDMVDRGRSFNARGLDSPGAKLSREDVLWAREVFSSGIVTQQMLSDVLGVSKSCISQVVRLETYVDAAS